MRATVRWRDVELELRLARDPGGEAPAWVRVGEVGIAHGALPEAMRAGLGDVRARLLATAVEGDATERAVYELLRDAMERTFDGASASLGVGLPRWPASLRIGRPAGGIWPFDAESTALSLGLRRLVKREEFSDASAVADAAWLAGRGFVVSAASEPDRDGRRVIFAARERHELDDALDLERALRSDGGESEAAGRALGERLGYPACCVEAYASARSRDDRGLARALLPPYGSPPSSPLTQWLSAPLGLVSHAPCSLACAPTLELAARLLEAVDAESSGFAARFMDLARRVHLVNEDRALALDVEAGTIVAAVELVHPGDDVPLAPARLARSAPTWIGRSLPSPAPAHGPEITVDGAPWFVADHRGG
ncbi:MAG: hypothetical protein AB7S26_13510 [Sandaracinaceae bacterium]